MKFTVNTKALCGLLLPIARGVAAKSINSGETVAMTVDAQAGLLTVRCAIPAVDVVATIPVTGVESPLSYPVATPVGVLVDFLQQVDYEEVHISVEGETLRLHLDNADASACFPVLEPMHPEPRTLEGELPAVRLGSSSSRKLSPPCSRPPRRTPCARSSTASTWKSGTARPNSSARIPA